VALTVVIFAVCAVRSVNQTSCAASNPEALMTDIHREQPGNTHRETITTNEVRAGTGGQQTNFVMITSTVGAVVAMAVVLIYLWNTW
jgi:hypothetical protein